MTEQQTDQEHAEPVEPVITEEQALAWLTTNTWCEAVIAEAHANRLAGRHVFGSDQRTIGGVLPTRPPNVVAFEVIDVVLQVVQGAAGVARRLAGEVLGVAVASDRPRATVSQIGGAAPAHGRGLMRAEKPVPGAGGDLAPQATTASTKPGGAMTKCAFVVENATNRTLHNVAFKLRVLASQSGSTIPSTCVSFKPAIFELRPYESQIVSVTIRTAEAKPGKYVGLAESGLFRQVISLDIA